MVECYGFIGWISLEATESQPLSTLPIARPAPRCDADRKQLLPSHFRRLARTPASVRDLGGTILRDVDIPIFRSPVRLLLITASGKSAGCSAGT
jgi:hypothetical protein